MRYVWASGSHVGKVRTGNEDSVYPETGGTSEGPVLVALADGMGGHVAGEVASQLAITTATAPEDADPADRVAAANSAIAAKAIAEPELLGMGTTLSLVQLDTTGKAHIGHVGDSRIYLFRSEDLTQLTTDHTLVAALYAAGQITADELDTHPKRHYLTRALGLDPSVEVDEFTTGLEPGDRLLLCSDGLTDMVPDQRIEQLLTGAAALEEAVWSLIEAANESGGIDNITVAIVDYIE